MSRRHSLLGPSTESSKTHRRSQSADARLKPSPLNTPTTAALKKPSSSRPLRPQPIIISSDEDEDEDEDESQNGRTPTRKLPQITISQSDTSLPRPNLTKPPGILQPKTPARVRPTVERQVVTDPGCYQKTASTTFDAGVAIPCPQLHWPPCHCRSYSRPGNMKRHVLQCSKCQEILMERKQKDNTYTDVEEGVKNGHGVRIVQQSEAGGEKEGAVPHDDDRDAEEDEEEAVHDNDKEGEKEKGEKEEDKEEGGGEEEGEEEEGGGTSANEVHSALIVAVCKELTPKDKEGFIYLLRDPGPDRKGLVKVGYTNDLDQRRKQHKKTCGLDISYIWVSNSVKHCRRIEKLAKLDLRHLCKPWTCERCHKEHREWYKIKEEMAVEIVKKWVDWLHEEEPYKHDKKLKPIWDHSIKYGRLPPRHFADHDHKSRWAHWNSVVLSPLSDNDTKRFYLNQVFPVLLNSMDLPQDSRALMYFVCIAIPVVLLLCIVR